MTLTFFLTAALLAFLHQILPEEYRNSCIFLVIWAAVVFLFFPGEFGGSYSQRKRHSVFGYEKKKYGQLPLAIQNKLRLLVVQEDKILLIHENK